MLMAMCILPNFTFDLITKKISKMKFSSVTLLVKDYKKCFEFYTQKLGLEVFWTQEGVEYSNFKMGNDVYRLALFSSDLWAQYVGNADKTQPVGYREKSVIEIDVENVDEIYQTLMAKGVEFINQPVDMPAWGARCVCLRDPEENIIWFASPLNNCASSS
jgi:catechol 2,3-dioxygenase-like lactoylglutathione lyase family enzyme